MGWRSAPPHRDLRFLALDVLQRVRGLSVVEALAQLACSALAVGAWAPRLPNPASADAEELGRQDFGLD